MPRVNQEIAARLFEKLVGAGKPVLYRNEQPFAARKLAQLGFDESRQLNPVSGASHNEALGIFSAKQEKDISSLIRGTATYPPMHSANIETVPLPSARYKSFSESEWDSQFNSWKDRGLVEPPPEQRSEEITRRLKELYDFVEYPDIIKGNINPDTGMRQRQVVQLNPNKGLAKFRPGAIGWNQTSEIYRILQAAGVAAPSIGMFQPETGTGECQV